MGKFNTHKTGIKAWVMARQGKYKYIRYMYQDYLDELYDLEADPEELYNLAVALNTMTRNWICGLC